MSSKSPASSLVVQTFMDEHNAWGIATNKNYSVNARDKEVPELSDKLANSQNRKNSPSLAIYKWLDDLTDEQIKNRVYIKSLVQKNGLVFTYERIKNEYRHDNEIFKLAIKDNGACLAFKIDDLFWVPFVDREFLWDLWRLPASSKNEETRQVFLNILLAESALLLFLELDLMLVAGGLILASAVGVWPLSIFIIGISLASIVTPIFCLDVALHLQAFLKPQEVEVENSNNIAFI